MSRARLTFLLVALVVLSWPAASDAAPVSSQQVQAAIEKAKGFLYGRQKNGHWEVVPQRQQSKGASLDSGQWGGLTAIATYALLASGESSQDLRVKQAIEFLKAADIVGIYALGMRAQVWAHLPPDAENLKLMRRDFELIRTSVKSKGDAAGMYNYVVRDGHDGRFDHSVSQYAVLGLWALAEHAGGGANWEGIDRAWRRHQNNDGGWGYQLKGGSTAAMTAAGVASLFITQDQLSLGQGGDCKGNPSDVNIEMGLRWIGDRFGDREGRRAHYTLYGIERIGVASGYKYFGRINWYEDGAAFLVATQQPLGCWFTDNQTADTCFGILFLVHGRAPLVMNKLQYDKEPSTTRPATASATQRAAPPAVYYTGTGNWNQRPRDAAHFVRWFSHASERLLNWQIVNLHAPPDELHDAPILYIAGNQTLNFSHEHLAKLRRYVEDGGLILGNADCASGEFVQGFRKVGQALFPRYEFRQLPADHVIFTDQQFHARAWKNPPAVMGLSNGARELMLLVPEADPARAWQAQTYKGKEETHELMADIFCYAVDRRNLRYKGETHLVRRDEQIPNVHKLNVARLQYEGNWDPEPGGWRRLANLMHNHYQVELAVKPVKLGEGKLDGSYHLAHLTGTDKVDLNDAQRDDLRKYVARGGAILIDACGGSSDFAESVEAQLAKVFPRSRVPGEVIPPEHPLFLVGERLDQIGYRTYARRVLGDVKVPRVRGIHHTERLAGLYSREDLSTGLVGQPVDGVCGYDPKSAWALVANWLLHVGGVRVAPVAGRVVALADVEEMNKQLDAFAQGWTVANCGKGYGIGLRKECQGRKDVFVTVPPDAANPCVLRKKIDVPAGEDTILQIVVGTHKSPDQEGDWQLIVRADGKELLKRNVRDKFSRDGWITINVNISEWAGRQAAVELEHRATGDYIWQGYWGRIATKSQ
jgi:hypothetical protein